MNILLLGPNGQVGWELRRTLAPLGAVVAVGRDGMNLADAHSIRACVRARAPQLIVNAAAYTAVDQAESEPELAQTVNGTAPGILAEEAKRLGASLVHFSTDYVFDGTREGPYSENDPPQPLNVYGHTKLAGEAAVAATGIPHLILRTSWVYGARGRNFLLTMLRLARERERLQVVDDQVGAPTWCRLIAETTAQIIAQTLAPHRGLSLAEVSGVYHLTAAGATSWYGFAQAIFSGDPRQGEHVLRECTPIPAAAYPTPAARPNNSLLDGSRLRETFGLHLPNWQTSLAQVLEDMG